jgi:hypothetical protein
MPISLPVVGTVSYNGYTFGAATETVSIRCESVKDSANRFTVRNKYTITLRTIIAVAAGSTTDATMQALRKTLYQTGKPFIYEDKGFGDLILNVPGGTADCNFGPKPIGYTWKPYAGLAACELEFTIEVEIPECSVTFAGRPISELNFKVDYKIGKDHLTTRSFTGHLIIANNRNGLQVLDSPDRYRELIYPNEPVGFIRDTRDFSVDESRTRLDVTIVDRELPGVYAPPPGCVDIPRIKHSYTNAEPRKFNQHIGKISGEYHMVKGFPAAMGYEHFLKVVRQRIHTVFNAIPPAVKGNNANPKAAPCVAVPGADAADKAKPIFGEPQPTTVLITGYNISEDDAMGATKLTMDISYLVLSQLGGIFFKYGLWEPIPDGNWLAWKASLGKIAGPRGLAQLGFSPQDDLIMNLCEQPAKQVNLREAVRRNNRPFDAALRSALDLPKPTKMGSWLHFKTRVSVKSDDSPIVHIPLSLPEQAGDAVIRNARNARIEGGKIRADKIRQQLRDASDKALDPPAKLAPIIQQPTSALPYVIFEGEAVRAGYPIDAPELVSLGGRKLVRANGPDEYFVHQEEQTDGGGTELYAAQWRVKYFVSNEIVDQGTNVRMPT